MPIATSTLALAAAVALACPAAFAQHSHSAAPSVSSYAGQQSRPIKALSEEEVKDLLSGAGMGFAKAAELNRYPGPSHALEHADALQLSAAQRDALKALLQRHKAEARVLGARVVELERELDAAFADRSATAESVDAILGRLAQASARLRGEHLKTHLEATALLTPAQVERYVVLRGYGAATAGHRH